MTAKLLGWQIQEVLTGNPPDEMTSFEVYPSEYVLKWLASREEIEPGRWRLISIYKGDIQNPEFPMGLEDGSDAVHRCPWCKDVVDGPGPCSSACLREMEARRKADNAYDAEVDDGKA